MINRRRREGEINRSRRKRKRGRLTRDREGGEGDDEQEKTTSISLPKYSYSEDNSDTSSRPPEEDHPYHRDRERAALITATLLGNEPPREATMKRCLAAFMPASASNIKRAHWLVALPRSFREKNGGPSNAAAGRREFEYAQLFAALIARTAKDIDVLIDSLPSEESTATLQAANLYRLEEENHEAAARLEEVVYRGDLLLEKIQSALADIAQSQLKTRSGSCCQPLSE
ncbi:hypothetical protein Chor_005201 [Crotalus horridus]